MIVVNYHADLNEVQASPALAALLSAPSAGSPFDRLAWWHGLAEHCGLEPLIAVAQDGDHYGVLPLQRDGAKLTALANWYNFTARPIFSAGADAPALVGAIARDLKRHAAQVDLAPLPNEDTTAALLETAFNTAGWIAFRTHSDQNHLLELAVQSFADYLAARPGPLRTTLKRKAGKVAVTIDTAFVPANWAAYETIYAESWKPGEGSPAFLRSFAEAEGAAGRLRLGLARADGVPVAAQLWTVEHNTAFIHKLAHTEASKPLSPGTTLTAALFEHVIGHDRVALIDFGTGDDGYKRDWMETVRPRYRLQLYRPEAARNWPAIARHHLRAKLRRG